MKGKDQLFICSVGIWLLVLVYLACVFLLLFDSVQFDLAKGITEDFLLLFFFQNYPLRKTDIGQKNESKDAHLPSSHAKEGKEDVHGLSESSDGAQNCIPLRLFIETPYIKAFSFAAFGHFKMPAKEDI